jgi:hypothetical protein
MKKRMLIRFCENYRHGLDLGRIIPIIMNHGGVSKFITGITFQIIEAPNTFWLFLLNLDYQMRNILFAQFPRWMIEYYSNNLLSIRLEAAIQSVVG